MGIQSRQHCQLCVFLKNSIEANQCYGHRNTHFTFVKPPGVGNQACMLSLS